MGTGTFLSAVNSQIYVIRCRQGRASGRGEGPVTGCVTMRERGRYEDRDAICGRRGAVDQPSPGSGQLLEGLEGGS